jgi:voltage-gated potassium channel
MKPRLASGIGVRLGRVRYSTVELLIALVLLFVVTPFVQDLRHGQLIEVLLLTFVLISAVFAIGARGRTLWIGGLLSATTLAARWTLHVYPHVLLIWVFHTAALLFLGFVVVQMLLFILRAPQVNSEVLCAAIAAYLLLGLVWALNYMLVARLSPDAFAFTAGPEAGRTMDNFNAFYFSFVVLSTVGFGDIIPISKAARMLAVIEAVTGMFYVTVLIARLVAMYAPSRTEPPDISSSP